MADTFDLLTLAEANAAVGNQGSNPGRDARVAGVVTEVSRKLDQLCGAVVTRGSTTEYHDGGHCRIRLRHPASAFTSVTEWQLGTSFTLTRETVGTFPVYGYYADPHIPNPTLYSGLLRRRSGGVDFDFYPGRGNIAVVYTAGRYATTAAVDVRFKEAAVIMLRSLWRGDEPNVVNQGEFTVPGQNFPTIGVPNAVLEVLSDELLPRFT